MRHTNLSIRGELRFYLIHGLSRPELHVQCFSHGSHLLCVLGIVYCNNTFTDRPTITDPAGKLEEELNKSLDEAAAAMEADFRACVRNSGLHSLSNRWRSAVEQSIAYSR